MYAMNRIFCLCESVKSRQNIKELPLNSPIPLSPPPTTLTHPLPPPPVTARHDQIADGQPPVGREEDGERVPTCKAAPAQLYPSQDKNIQISSKSNVKLDFLFFCTVHRQLTSGKAHFLV